MEMISPSTISFSDLLSLSRDVAALNLGYLTVAVTILVLLGGAFYLFNIKPFKEALERQGRALDERERKEREVIDKLQIAITEKLDSFQKEQKVVIDELLKTNNEKVALETANAISSLENSIFEKLETIPEGKDIKLKELIMSEVENELNKLEKVINTRAEETKANAEKQFSLLTGKVDSSLKDIKEQKRQIRTLEVYRYSKEGKMGAVYGSIDLLASAIEENWEFRIADALDDLEKEIKGFILAPAEVTRIEECIAKIEKERKYDPLIKKVRATYQTL